MVADHSSPDKKNTQSLPVLRALIDAIDHELLQLLSRRNGLVTEVASYKRHHSVPIRDGQRESEIISDRRERSVALGLRPDVIESIFRLMLWASRDRQAALKAEVPPDIETRTVAIIGGKGAMGGCMAQMFADLGHAVMIADVDTELTPEEAARSADVVIISVPIDRTVGVIRQIGPLVRKDALLADVTSIKSAPVEAMLEASKASVIGMHPLFGPSVHSVQGQRIVLTPAREGRWLQWLEQMLKARGLLVVRATPEEHDRSMAVVQVLTHFSTEVAGLAMARMGVDFEKTLETTSPVYLMDMIMTARHFAQSPDLYASIHMSNPDTRLVIDAFKSANDTLARAICESDSSAVASIFEDVREYFGPFTKQALDQSSYLIDRLVERT